MPQLVETSTYLEDLPKYQKERFWNLVNNIGHGRDSYLTNTPVAITPDGKHILQITTNPSLHSNSSDVLGVISVASIDSHVGEIEDLPVMNRQDMMTLAR